jgi:hypothetical protein
MKLNSDKSNLFKNLVSKEFFAKQTLASCPANILYAPPCP